MRIAWFIGTLLISSCLWALPTKSDGASDKHPASESKNDKKTQGVHYPTKDAPLPVTVLQSVDDAEYTKQRDNKADKFNTDNLDVQIRLAKVAEKQFDAAVAAAVIATIGTFVAGFALYFLIGTYREGKKAANASIVAANAASAQTELARKEFISSHRPKLILKNFRLDVTYGENSIRVDYRVVNVGETAAKIILWNNSWVIKQIQFPIFPLPPRYLPHEQFVDPPILDGGQSHPGGKTVVEAGDGESFRRLTQQKHMWAFYFFGLISYLDDLGNRRDLSFCRRFNFDTERFEVGDADYDYSD